MRDALLASGARFDNQWYQNVLRTRRSELMRGERSGTAVAANRSAIPSSQLGVCLPVQLFDGSEAICEVREFDPNRHVNIHPITKEILVVLKRA